MLLGERLRAQCWICAWSLHWANGNSSAELLWRLYVFVLNCFSCVWLTVTLLDGSPPGSSVHRILQARILEWVAVPSSRVWRLRWVKWYMFSAASGQCLEWSRYLISGIIIIIWPLTCILLDYTNSECKSHLDFISWMGLAISWHFREAPGERNCVRGEF